MDLTRFSFEEEYDKVNLFSTVIDAVPPSLPNPPTSSTGQLDRKIDKN